MQKQNVQDKYFNIFFLTALTATAIFFTFLLRVYIKWDYLSFALALLMLIYLVSMLFTLTDKQVVSKLAITLLTIITLLSFFLYVAESAGLAESLRDENSIREWIAAQGGKAEIFYLFLQFAQVVFLPIPGMVTIIAGSLIFGPFKAAVLSLVGILVGSIVAFGIGRFFGKKVVAWIAGEDALNKYIKMIKGRDKFMLTAMFLLPFFPDDILCLISGISTMSFLQFVITITICRIMTSFITAYLGSGSVIPYSGWGLYVWAVLGIIVVAIMVLLWKYGDRIQKWLSEKFIKKSKKKRRQ